MKKTKKHVGKNKYLRNALILMLTFLVFIAVDLLTKNFIFDPIVAPKGHGSKFIANWEEIIGWRSQAHYRTMFFDWLNITIPNWYILVIGYSLGATFIFFAIFSNKKFVTFCLSIALAGIIGNTFDNTNFKYVRNIMYIPWLDKGTFNFADTWIIMGTFLAFISIMVSIIKESKNKKNVTKSQIIKK